MSILPEVLVALAAVALVLSARLRLRARYRRWLPAAALLAVAAALVLELSLGAAVGTLFNGGLLQDRFALFAKAAILLALGLAIAAADWELELSRPVLSLALLAALGGLVAASASNLLGLWCGLELAAVAGAAAAAARLSAAAGVRLLVASSAGGGLLAIGFGLVYAISGVSSLEGIRTEMGVEPLALPLALAILLGLAGIGLRLILSGLVAAASEVPQGSPLGSGVLAGLTGGAAAIVLVKFTAAVAAVAPAWSPYLAVLGAVAMLVGGLRALAAGTARGLVGWLVAGQAGWLLAGLAVNQRAGATGALLILAALVVAATCAPVLLADLDVERLAGLGRAQPARAAALTLALLSLAGVPPLAGFFGEFAVAAGLVGSGLGWVLAVGLLGWVLGLVAVTRAISPFYLEGAGDEQRRGAGAPPAVWSLGAAAAGVALLALTLFANPISSLAFQGAEALGLR